MVAAAPQMERALELAMGPVTLTAARDGVTVQASTNVEVSISVKTTTKYSSQPEVLGVEISGGQGVILAGGIGVGRSASIVSSSVRVGIGIDLSPVAAKQGIPLPAAMDNAKMLQLPVAASSPGPSPPE